MPRPSLSLAVALLAVVTTIPPVGAADPPTADVTIRSIRFDPVELVVAQGTRVRWRNVTSPSRAHDVVSSLPGYFASPLLVNGQGFRTTFGAAGTFTYVCSIHDVMIGSVEVPLSAELVTSGHVPYFLLTLGTTFLAQASPWRYVLEWRMPGATRWEVKASRDNTLVVLATTPGMYSFRARLKAKGTRTHSANTPEVSLEYVP